MSSEFQKEALSSFVFDVAGRKAIRHLYDTGFSAEMIKERLDYPVSLSRIEMEIELYEKEKQRDDGEEYIYEKVYGKYGRTYFKKVKK